jgi:hypothetical protein
MFLKYISLMYTTVWKLHSEFWNRFVIHASLLRGEQDSEYLILMYVKMIGRYIGVGRVQL